MLFIVGSFFLTNISCEHAFIVICYKNIEEEDFFMLD